MRLLVSVTSAEEARLAVAGGVDVVDVKNPAEGSLGAPVPTVIEAVRAVVPPGRPVSVAIGDMPHLPGTAALAAAGAAGCGADYVKVGLWGSSTEEEAVAVLIAVRAAAGDGAAVIAAAYADADRAPGLPPAVTRGRGAAGGSGGLPARHGGEGRARTVRVAHARRARGAGRRGARGRARDRARGCAARRGPFDRPRDRRGHRGCAVGGV